MASQVLTTVFFVLLLDLACCRNFSADQIPKNVTTLHINVPGGIASFGDSSTFVGAKQEKCGKCEFDLLFYVTWHAGK